MQIIKKSHRFYLDMHSNRGLALEILTEALITLHRCADAFAVHVRQIRSSLFVTNCYWNEIVFSQKVNKRHIIEFEPVHEISNNVVCATSKASDQPAHTRSLIRAFASRLSIL